jgi:hypothetical protein
MQRNFCASGYLAPAFRRPRHSWQRWGNWIALVSPLLSQRLSVSSLPFPCELDPLPNSSTLPGREGEKVNLPVGASQLVGEIGFEPVRHSPPYWLQFGYTQVLHVAKGGCLDVACLSTELLTLTLLLRGPPQRVPLAINVEFEHTNTSLYGLTGV